MVLLLSEPDIVKIMDMKSTISCLEAAFNEQSNDRVIQPNRQLVREKDSDAVVRIMSASVPLMEALGLKALLGMPAKRRPGSTYFVTLLFDTKDAALLAIIAANRLTQLRTGGASGIATRHLARKGAATVGIVGAGVQGYGQLEGVAASVQVTGGRVFDVDFPRADAMIARARKEIGVEMQRASRVEELYGCDILCTATTATTPALFGNRLERGTHINAIGSNAPTRQEIDPVVLNRSKVFVDRLEQVLEEAGDFVVPIKQGLYSSQRISGNLCDVLTGKITGRESDMQITLFKGVGIAIEDIAVARRAYELASRNGMGQEISL